MMVAGMPLGLTLGLGPSASVPVISALTLSRGGNAITLNRQLYDAGVRSLADFKAALAHRPDQVHTLAAVHPASMQNLLLRHWLASGGIDPDRDVTVTMIPPPRWSLPCDQGRSMATVWGNRGTPGRYTRASGWC